MLNQWQLWKWFDYNFLSLEVFKYGLENHSPGIYRDDSTMERLVGYDALFSFPSWEFMILYMRDLRMCRFFSWAPKNWCFWTVVLEKILESPLDCKEIQPVHPKGNQCWIFIGKTDDEAETPVHCPPNAKNWLIWKDLDVGKDWRWEEKEMAENEMVGWHHQLNGHEFE